MTKAISLVNTLAAQIRKSTGCNRSESMLKAWALIKATPDAKVLVFAKLRTGEVSKRIVSARWFDFYKTTGGTSRRKEGQLLFADLAKVVSGSNPIISTYQSQILN